MTCVSCGGRIPGGSAFCSWCGSRTPAAVAAAWPETPPEVPEWRGLVPGWLLLHVGIILVALWPVQLLVLKAVVALAGGDVRLLAVDVVPALTGGIAWMLIVYLRVQATLRSLALAGVLGVGLVLGSTLNVVLLA